ncbi:MAG: gliding motility-associated C-terminal domain-containing protein [Gelidibacter sp.]
METGGTDVSDLSDDDSVALKMMPRKQHYCQRPRALGPDQAETFSNSDGDGCNDAGETITYTFTVTNQGNVHSTNVVLNDPMLGGDIALASGDTDSDNELDVDETWIYTSDYAITQSDIDAGLVSNQATVTGTGTGGTDVSDLSDDDSVLEDDATETTLCQETPGIALIKTGTFNDSDGDGCSDAGETITYTFTVTNQGNTSITDVVLNDPMLGGDIALESGDTDSDSELDVDETWIYTSDYAVTQSDIDAGMVSNQATVTGTGTGGTDVSDLSDDDSVLEDDATETTLCQETPGIALIKTGTFNDSDGDGCSDAGETITYTFTVTNQGNTSITNVVLNDPMLGGDIALESGDTDSDSELDVDETWVYTSDYAVTQSDIDAGMVSNQAAITGISDGMNVMDLSDDNSILEDDITVTPLCNSGSISLEKTSFFNDENGDGATQIGETISYTFTVYNTGPVTLYDITIEDDLVGVTITGGPIEELPPGGVDSTTFTATYSVLEQDFDTMLVINQAIVHAFDVSRNPVTDTSDDPTDLTNNDINGDGEPDDPTETVLPEVLSEEFEIFNAVSPDGDGMNDFFRIVGIENYPNNNLKIFNRWGVLIYETDGYGINGKVFRGVSEGRVTISKNDELPTGSYFYVLTRFVNGQKTLTNEGYLYIKRN